MRTNRRNWIFGLVVMAALFSCNGQKDASDAFGNFEADDQLISSEIAGRLLSCNFEEGKLLARGDLVAVVDSVPIELQINQLEAQKKTILARRQSIRTQVAVIDQQKKNLSRDQARIKNMLKDGAATQKQMDDVDGSLDVMDRQAASTKSQDLVLTGEEEVVDTQLAQLKDRLGRCRIYAPVGGLVLEKYKKEGELAGQGQSLCRIADVSSLNLRVYVSGDQLPHIRLGQQVQVMIDDTATKNRKLEGTVTWISSEAEFTPKIIQTKVERVKLVYAVKVKVANDGALKIGMPGEIKFMN